MTPPRTPPRTTQIDSWIPPTPRYAPIDEPDNFPWSKHSQASLPDSLNDSMTSKCLTPRRDGKHFSHRVHNGRQTPKTKSVSNLVLPLTPEQTPVRPKRKKNIDEIISVNEPLHNSRIMFPTGTPVKGSGRSYKSPRRIACTSSSIDIVNPLPPQKLPLSSSSPYSESNNHLTLEYSQTNIKPSNLIHPDETTRIDSLAISSPRKHKPVHISALTGDEQDEEFEIFNDKEAFLDDVNNELDDYPLEYAEHKYRKQKKITDPFTQRLQASIKKKQPTQKLSFELAPKSFEITHNIDKINGREYDSEKYFDVLEDAYFRSKGMIQKKSQPETTATHHCMEEYHPHDLQQGSSKIPGMWFVFRGKKVFRPYPRNDDTWVDFKPKILFPESKKDSKSLRESSTPLPGCKRKAGMNASSLIFSPLKTQSSTNISSMLSRSPPKKNTTNYSDINEDEVNASFESVDTIDSADELTDHEDDVPSVVIQTPRKVALTPVLSSSSRKRPSPSVSQQLIAPILASPRQQPLKFSSHPINETHHIHYASQQDRKPLKRSISTSSNQSSLLYSQHPEHTSSSPAKRSKKDNNNKYFFR